MTSDVKIDVIIPVYNAFPYVEKCVNSIEKYLDRNVEQVIVYNDCSTEDTAQKLDDLGYKKVRVVHGEVNLGFGGAVNTAFKYATSSYVLVLNSDTEADDDFLTDLINILDSNSSIAAINPIQNDKYYKKYKNYADKIGYVRNYQLSGYAFLIRKKVFDEIGGFRKEFGRGYFEDNALARDICNKGYSTGICITSLLRHAVSKSFDVSSINEMMQKNEVIFEKKYPKSKKRVLVIGKLSSDAIHDVEKICIDGGRLYLYGHNFLNFSGVCPRIESVSSFFKLLSLINRNVIRGKKRKHMIDDIWVSKSAGFLEKYLVRLVASVYSIDIKVVC